MPDSSTPQEALQVLEQFDPGLKNTPSSVVRYLRQAAQSSPEDPEEGITCRWRNFVIGNNATAVDAAGEKAVELGYRPVMQSARELEGPAEQVGRHLAQMALHMAQDPSAPDCLISGGEPTVQLPPPSQRGTGGRNQQLVLAALVHLLEHEKQAQGVLILSGGTDGEDGPTDAAGAWVDAQVLRRVGQWGLRPQEHLRRCDAYPFFEQLHALLKTGPTGTNVCDLRVVLVSRVPQG